MTITEVRTLWSDFPDGMACLSLVVITKKDGHLLGPFGLSTIIRGWSTQ